MMGFHLFAYVGSVTVPVHISLPKRMSHVSYVNCVCMVFTASEWTSKSLITVDSSSNHVRPIKAKSSAKLMADGPSPVHDKYSPRNDAKYYKTAHDAYNITTIKPP